MPLLHFGKKRRKSVVPMPQAVEMLAQMSNAIVSEEASKRAVAPRPWRSALLAAGLALALVLGSSVRPLPTLGFAQLWQEAPAKSAIADANELHALQVELAALRASLDRIWPCERLPPVGKEVIDPVGLTLFVQTIYEAFTAHGISFYDQPSENADSWKSKREKEKHCQWWYTRRFSDSLTQLDATYVVRRPGLCFGADQPLGLVFCENTGFRCLRWSSVDHCLLCDEDLAHVRTRDYRRVFFDVWSADIRRG